MTSFNPARTQQFQKTTFQQAISVETRFERDGNLTYHQVVSDATTGVITEHVYDSQRRLIKVLRRAQQGCYIETFYNPVDGEPTRLSEVARTPDGNSLSREIVYREGGRSSEVVTIINSGGLLLRLTEREAVGSRNIYQAETQYNHDGSPSSTVTQHMCPETGELTHREHVTWYCEGQRAMTEHYYFQRGGRIARYIKVLYYAGGGPFSEEFQEFHPLSGRISRRQLVAYNPEGYQTCFDVLHYADDGGILERSSTFFDDRGQPVAVRNSIGDEAA